MLLRARCTLDVPVNLHPRVSLACVPVSVFATCVCEQPFSCASAGQTCEMPHQEDESLCAFVLWRTYVLGVLRGELLHCKKWAESPTSDFENKNLINCQGGELDFFLIPCFFGCPCCPPFR